MSSRAPRTPKFRLHKPTGQAVVTIDGRDHYLGKHDAAESRERYDRLIAEWLANGRWLRPDPGAALTVTEVLAAFWRHAESYYVTRDGTPSGELDNFRHALRPVKRLYATLPAKEFGPLALRAVRSEMVRLGWCRTNVNRQVKRVVLVFRWASGQELVPGSVPQNLAGVEALKRGKTDARESAKVRPVADAHVEAIRPFVSRQVWALIELQRLSGARGGELFTLRPMDIDRQSHPTVWLYKPEQHKTAHHGHDRVIPFGPKAQAVLKPFLANRRPDAFLFSPEEAEHERHVKQRFDRATPLTPSQRARAEVARVRASARQRAPEQHFTKASYARAIARACGRADRQAHEQNPDVPKAQRLVPHWHPHQLRHGAATRIRRELGLELAMLFLGQKSLSMAALYAEADESKVHDAAARLG